MTKLKRILKPIDMMEAAMAVKGVEEVEVVWDRKVAGARGEGLRHGNTAFLAKGVMFL